MRKLVAMSALLVVVVAWGCSGSDDGDQPAAAVVASDFQVASPIFSEIRSRVRIPPENTCYGDNLSPPLKWSGAPQGTKSFALIGEDVDHHTGTWAHWVLYNIPPTATELAEGIPTTTDQLPNGTVQGSNDFKNVGYEGPCPLQTTINFWQTVGDQPTSQAAHRYVFTLYALDTTVSLAAGANREQLKSAMDNHILAQADTVGKFQVAPTTDAKEDFNRSLYGEPTPTPTAQ